jgi:hypothetical protein
MDRGVLLQRTIDRRSFIKSTAITAGAAALSIGAVCDPYLLRRAKQDETRLAPHHSAWVWQFASDGNPEAVAEGLAEAGLGALVKTHDGVDWMSRYDRSSSAINGPAQVERIARIFEREGVILHAWSVVKGVDPIREAQMTADVLSAGARTMVLDLEGSAGFWVGSRDDALRYGDELRRLTPFGRVDISIDARPWRIYHNVPMDEFVMYTDGIWPQLYWDTFNNAANINGYASSGYPVGPGGMTPEFLIDTTAIVLAPYGREVVPVGQGAAADPFAWERFNYRAWHVGWPQVSIWRYGVARADALEYFADNRAGAEPQLPRTPTPAPTSTSAITNTPTIRPTKTPRNTKTPTRTPTHTPTPTKTPLTTATPTVNPATATGTATPGP